MSSSLQEGWVKRLIVCAGTLRTSVCIMPVSAWLRKLDSWVGLQTISPSPLLLLVYLLALISDVCIETICISKLYCRSKTKRHWGTALYNPFLIIFINTVNLSYTTFLGPSCSCSLPHAAAINVLLAHTSLCPLKAPCAFVIYESREVLLESFCTDCTFSLMYFWAEKIGH